MITLLDKFTEKYGFKAGYIFNNKSNHDEAEKKCIKVISYMLSDVYELSNERVCQIVNRGVTAINRYINDVQDDFDLNDSLLYGEMFDELLDILEDGESKGIKIE